MVLKLKDALGNTYEVPGIRGTGINGVWVEEDSGSYKLMVHLTNGETVEAGTLPSATPVGTHTHGNLTYDGKLGTAAGKLVETGEGGAITAGRKIVSGTTPPEEVTGLSAGDIYLYYQE